MSSAAAPAVTNGAVRGGGGVPRPTNPMVTPLLTDLYQFTMAYAYWKAGKHLDRAVFDLYFRKNPFAGEFTIFGGLEECIRFIANFKLKEEEIRFLRSALPTCEDGFFEYLSSIDCSDVEVYAIPEGSVVFPKVPLMIIEGPVAVYQELVVQLLGTPFLSLVNYASLVTTNAARHRLVAGKPKNLLEFGLRRAQGPDGGISASRYSYMGRFDATSNVAAGRLFGIPIRGTHSHAFNWLIRIQDASSLRGTFGETNQSELAAFTSYALAFPNSFLALVDTYDVMRSGVPNFCAVALALNDMGVTRLYGKEGYPLVDIMTGEDEPSPKVGERLLCRHPFNESKRAHVVPQHVEELLKCYWPGNSSKPREEPPSIKENRSRCMRHLDQMRPDHLRRLNPTPYKVSVSAQLYDFIHFLWLNEAPVGELQ